MTATVTVEVARHDAPWVWGFHPKEFSLSHSWLMNGKPNNMARNNLKYLRVDAQARANLRSDWNRPILWPILLVVLALAALVVPAVMSYRRRERRAGKG